MNVKNIIAGVVQGAVAFIVFTILIVLAVAAIIQIG